TSALRVAHDVRAGAPALARVKPGGARRGCRLFRRPGPHRLRALGALPGGTAIGPPLHAQEGIGAPVKRREDRRFLLGRGRYVADLDVAGMLHCVLVRSVHAHAALRRIDTARACTAPGVIAVFTGADMAADGVGPMRPLWAISCSAGRPTAEPARLRHSREPATT